MALKKLIEKGYGQVELNQAPFRRAGAIEAQCKIAEGIEYLENGMLLAVNRVARTVGYPTGTEGELIALHYSAERMYEEDKTGLKDFRLDKGTFLPRLGYIGAADKFTTNTVVYDDATQLKDYKYGKPCTQKGYEGYIELTTTKEGAVVEVLEITTMPDGQKAVKFGGLN